MSGRVFLLPAVALLVAGATYGPALWHRFYEPVREYCEMYLAGASAWSLASPVIVGVGLIAFAGAGFRLVTHVRSDGELIRQIRGRIVPPPAAVERAATTAGLNRPVICVNVTAPVAFCRGFVSPRVYVSTALINLLDEEELHVVLAHEGVHASRYDPLRALVARFLAGIALLLPIVRLLEERYLLALEIRADEHAADAHSLPHLASALLKLLEAPAAGTFARGSLAINPTEERIRRLTAKADGSIPYGIGLHTLSRPIVWSVASSMLAVAVVALTVQVVSSVSRCSGMVA
ncbi:MAG: M56 family metallopeptidase [Chloroflexi bacterium]|nr:M56 family metallopeptidase [Chloroflexota bacterium]